jgi:replication initiation and membrane attachment protein
MIPADNYQVYAHTVTMDVPVLVKYYLPILGPNALMLYQYLYSQPSGMMMHIMDAVGYSRAHDLEESLDSLSALKLLDFYQVSENEIGIKLHSHLSPEAFSKDMVLMALLKSKVTESVFEGLFADLQAEPVGTKLSKSFGDVFPNLSGSLESKPAVIPGDQPFNLDAFMTRMKETGLVFTDESQEVLDILGLADKYKMDWFNLYHVAEETAVNHRLNTAAMMRRLSGETAAKAISKDQFTDGELEMISVAKSVSPIDFLQQMKRQIGGFVSGPERSVLNNMDKAQVPSAVQNMLIFYYLVVQKKASISTYAMNVASEWDRDGINTPEAAMIRIKNYDAVKAEKQKAKPATPGKGRSNQPVQAAKQVPDWHEDNYTEGTLSQEDLDALDKLLNGGDDA